VEGIEGVLADGNVRVVAVVGSSKNTGKTTTMNRILAGLPGDKGPYGVLSIGIDGEETDFWLRIDKPRIYVTPGTLIATGKKALTGGTASVSVIDVLGAPTPMGELALCRVEKAGAVLLCGVRHKADLDVAVRGLLAHGAVKVLVDGSYQRLAAADPTISQGVILATGAVVGDTIQEVASRTREILDRLLLPEFEDKSVLDLMESAIRHGAPALSAADGGITFLKDAGDPVAPPETPGGGTSRGPMIAFPGAITDEWLRSVSRLGPGTHVISSDPTRLFASPESLAGFRSMGGRLTVIRGIRLLAVTVNPFSVTGASLPGPELLEAVRAVAPGVPVFMFEGVQ